MTTTPESKPESKIAEAISAVMARVKNVEKKGENKFHGYKFARIEDLLAQVQPAMAENGLIIVQDELKHELIAGDSVMTATYEFTLAHTSGQVWPIKAKHTGMSSARNSKGGFDDKALNKCHTAARKYFLLALFQIPAGDLPDADTEADKESHQPSNAVSDLIADLNGCPGDKPTLRQWKKENLPEIDSLPESERVIVVRAFSARWERAGVKAEPKHNPETGELPEERDYN